MPGLTFIDVRIGLPQIAFNASSAIPSSLLGRALCRAFVIAILQSGENPDKAHSSVNRRQRRPSASPSTSRLNGTAPASRQFVFRLDVRDSTRNERPGDSAFHNSFRFRDAAALLPWCSSCFSNGGTDSCPTEIGVWQNMFPENDPYPYTAQVSRWS